MNSGEQVTCFINFDGGAIVVEGGLYHPPRDWTLFEVAVDDGFIVAKQQKDDCFVVQLLGSDRNVVDSAYISGFTYVEKESYAFAFGWHNRKIVNIAMDGEFLLSRESDSG